MSTCPAQTHQPWSACPTSRLGDRTVAAPAAPSGTTYTSCVRIEVERPLQNPQPSRFSDAPPVSQPLGPSSTSLQNAAPIRLAEVRLSDRASEGEQWGIPLREMRAV